MQRLWVRLAVTIGAVILVSVIVPPVLFYLLNQAGIVHPLPPTLAGVVAPVVQAQLREYAVERFAPAYVRGIVVGGLLGIGLGIWISRQLTAPLEELASAAQAIGARQLSRRVRVQGTREVMGVAEAFNEMARELESAESLRKSLLADVAHELRSPLTVIQGNLRAILDDVYPLDKTEVARLYDQTRHLSRLVDDLHIHAQAEARELPLNLLGVDIPRLLPQVAAAFESLAETQDVSLRVETPPALPLIRADAVRLTQVLHNLLTNALRHTPPGGAITLSAGQVENTIHLVVSDTGEGIPPEHLPHIFERFYQADQSRRRDKGGIGLGLAIAHAIVEAHGGSIRAESSGQDQGSAFTIIFPLLPMPVPRPAPEIPVNPA